MSETWYCAKFGRIKKVCIERETDKMVYFENGRREAKVSDYYFYAKTFYDVKKHILEDYYLKRSRAMLQVDILNEKIANIDRLNEDDIK